MIGLVLGETQLGHLIIKKLRLLKKKFIIIDISKKKIFKKNKNFFPLSIGQLGKAISILKKHGCKKIIFAGKITTPNFSKTKFDFKALYYLPKIIKGAKKGDASIIKVVIEIFKKEGFKIISSAYFNPELLLKRGNHTKIKPDFLSKKDMLKGKSIINDNLDVFKRLGRVSNVSHSELDKNGVKIIVGGETVILYFDQNLDLNEQKQKISKKVKDLNYKINGISDKLKNKSFLKNAPKQIVVRVKKALTDYKIELKKLNSILNSIKN